MIPIHLHTKKVIYNGPLFSKAPFLRIMVFCFAGELCYNFLICPSAHPGPSVYGLPAFAGRPQTGVGQIEQVRTAALFLIGIFPLLFVPAAAGVMDLWAELHAMLLPVLIALVPVTFLVMATAGRVTQRFAKAEPELEEELAK